MCSILDDPDNGRIECSLGEDGEPTEGDTCIYICDDGFMLTGDDVVRECQSDGSWSGSIPTCERGKTSFLYYVCLYIDLYVTCIYTAQYIVMYVHINQLVDAYEIMSLNAHVKNLQ